MGKLGIKDYYTHVRIQFKKVVFHDQTSSYLTMMPRMRQALIEFENVEDAVNCVSNTQTSQVYIMDRPVFFNFSTSQEITRQEGETVDACTFNFLRIVSNIWLRSPYGISPSVGGSMPHDMDAKNHILLFTIFNPMYPITVVRMKRERYFQSVSCEH